MEEPKSNPYLALIITINVLLAFLFFGKNLLEYFGVWEKLQEFLDRYSIIFAAGLLGATSFVLINWFTKKSADDALTKITDSTTTIVDRAMGKATEDIQKEVTNITKESMKNAVKEMKGYTKKAKKDLDGQLKLVRKATSELENWVSNQSILVQMQYSIERAPRGQSELEISPFHIKHVRDQLMEGNLYELVLKSNNSQSIYYSEGNKFGLIRELDEKPANMDENFTNSYKEVKGLVNLNPQKISINFMLGAINLGFQVNDMKVGDLVEFKVEKIAAEETLNKRRLDDPEYFKHGFQFFSLNDNSGWPKTSVDMKIRLRNGRSFDCKLKSTSIVGDDFSGLKSIAEIVKINN